MSQPRNAYKRQQQARRTARHEQKRATKRDRELRRAATRQQTPELWRNRKKGHAVTGNTKRLIKRVSRKFPFLMGKAA
jgi:hypothetical protein